ncbi:MAG: hypothetical protein ACTHNW_13195 [Mucilaginibacter sp.]
MNSLTPRLYFDKDDSALMQRCHVNFPSAQSPDGKPGREYGLRAEGFFRLDLLVTFGSSQK